MAMPDEKKLKAMKKEKESMPKKVSITKGAVYKKSKK